MTEKQDLENAVLALARIADSGDNDYSASWCRREAGMALNFLGYGRGWQKVTSSTSAQEVQR